MDQRGDDKVANPQKQARAADDGCSIHRKGIEPSTETCNNMIRALISSKAISEARSFFRNMPAAPDVATFTLILSSHMVSLLYSHVFTDCIYMDAAYALSSSFSI